MRIILGYKLKKIHLKYIYSPDINQVTNIQQNQGKGQGSVQQVNTQGSIILCPIQSKHCIYGILGKMWIRLGLIR